MSTVPGRPEGEEAAPGYPVVLSAALPSNGGQQPVPHRLCPIYGLQCVGVGGVRHETRENLIHVENLAQTGNLPPHSASDKIDKVLLFPIPFAVSNESALMA